MVERRFSAAAEAVSNFVGSVGMFAGVTVALGAWILIGLLTHWSEAWLNTGNACISVLTLYLLVLLQHSANHGNRASQIKLDGLVSASEKAADDLIRVEDRQDDELDEIREGINPAASGG